MDKRKDHSHLIEKAQKGDQRAFRELYELYKHSLFMVCLRYGKDRSTAQDYLQDAFINIYRNLKQFDSQRGAFESWAKRITVNVCLGDIRKNTLDAVNITGAEQVESQDISILSKLSMQEMMAMIQKLPFGYRTVFNMYVIDGYSHKEIAAELNISISTSKSQLMKARNLLQKKIVASKQFYNQEHG